MKWQTPKLISLSEQQAHGKCQTGSGEGPGNCKNGPIASGASCRDGGSAQPSCKFGGGALVKRKTGY